MWTRLSLWLSSLFKREQFDRDLNEEVAFHVKSRADDLTRQGLTAQEAARQARLEFGAPDNYKDQVREVRRGLWFEQLLQDLRYGARVLVRRPAFSLAASLTLALGIGATAAVFSLLDVALLRPLPVRAPEALAHIYTSCRAGGAYCTSSYPDFEDYREQSRAFEDMAAFDIAEVNVATDSSTWVGQAMLVTTNYFALLEIAPAHGRLIAPSSDTANDPVIVLAYDTWLRRFGGDPAVVDRLVRLNGNPYQIAGIAPQGFRGTRLDNQPDMWMALDQTGLVTVNNRGDALIERESRWIDGTIGRLRSGVSLTQAQADMTLVSDGLRAEYPVREGRFITVESAQHAALPPVVAGNITRVVWLLMGGVTATLLVACANVAGLLLARGVARRHELELRRALGAGRWRLVRQLLAEHLILSVAGGVGGLVIAGWGVGLLSRFDLPGALAIGSLDLRLNQRVLTFAVLLLGVAAMFGLVPALSNTRGLTAHTQGRTTSEGTAGRRGQGVLLAVQVSVTIVLLFGAGLFIRSLQHGLGLDLGLDSDGVVMARVSPALERYSPERTMAVLDEAMTRVKSMPGVAAVSVARQEPLRPGSGFLASEIAGYAPSSGERMRFETNLVAPAYFTALGIPLRAGRDFTDRDRAGAPLVAIVSDTMARRFWPGRSPIGGTIFSASFPSPLEVVGVVGDVTVGLEGTAEPFVYLSIHQHPRFLQGPASIVVMAKTAGDPNVLATSIRSVLRSVDSAVPIVEVATLEDRVGTLLMPQRLGTALLSVLAGLTVTLVAVGIVGTVGYGVSRRRREIGVRLALGARRSQVTAVMTREALIPVAIGLIVGGAAAFALGDLASAFLFGIAPTDGPAFVGAVAALALVAAIASVIPAWRASGLNATEVLGAE